MKKIISLFSIITLIFLSGCELDSFLFNIEKIDSYTLPGNTIPESDIEPVTLTSNGSKIYGFWIKSDGTHPEATILYCHGNKHNIDEYWDRVMLMHRLGVNVFIFDYQGFGKSEGESSQANMYSDAEAALDFVINEKHIESDSLCIYGYSLGNVVSIYLAANKINPACLIAESAFASANSLTQGSIGLDIPSLWLTEADFNNAEMIKKIKTKFLLFHGAKDDFVRYEDNGRVVYQNAPEPKQLVLVQNANHTTIPETMGIENYLETISDLMFNKIK